jgi:hypothetical protein
MKRFGMFPPDVIVTIQYQIEHIPEIVTECREMLHRLLAHNSGTKTVKLRNGFRRMIMRIETVIKVRNVRVFVPLGTTYW